MKCSLPECDKTFVKKTNNHHACCNSHRVLSNRRKKGKPNLPEQFIKKEKIGKVKLYANKEIQDVQREIFNLQSQMVTNQSIRHTAALAASTLPLFTFEKPSLKDILFCGFVGYFLGNVQDKKNEYINYEYNNYLNQKITDAKLKIKQLETIPVPYKKELPTSSSISDYKDFQDILAHELSNVNKEVYNLTGKWRYFIGYMPKNFSAIIYGKPKQGKTHFAIQWAQYLQDSYGDVIYVSGEEGIERPFKEKIERYDCKFRIIFNPKGSFGICSAIDKYKPKFVFIDSLNRLALNITDIRRFKDTYENTSFIYIMQATKDGRFRGSLEIEHEVTSTIKVENGSANHTGRTIPEPTELKIFQ